MSRLHNITFDLVMFLRPAGFPKMNLIRSTLMLNMHILCDNHAPSEVLYSS